MHGYSVKLKGNLQRGHKSGTSALYLQVIINRVKKPFPLDIRWPKHLIDNKKNCILQKEDDSQEFYDVNMEVNTKISLVNEIFKLYRLADNILTMPQFEREYKTFGRRKDFLIYMETKLQDRFNGAEITERTYKNGMASLGKLQEFRQKILFHELDNVLLNGWKKFLQGKGNTANTIWGNLKDVKAYLKLAAEENIAINLEHQKTKTGKTTHRIVWLEDAELRRMYKLFKKEVLPPIDQESLRAFLFQCFTSLRISDVFLANWGWVNSNNDMQFVPKKNERFKMEVTVPLSDTARALITKNRGLFFSLPPEQVINRSLKKIAGDCGIKKILTTHVGRHTFGTLFYRHTKDILSLNKIMGHTKLETTMVYAHVNDEDKREGVRKYEEGLNLEAD